jgi:hypothetical protein
MLSELIVFGLCGAPSLTTAARSKQLGTPGDSGPSADIPPDVYRLTTPHGVLWASPDSLDLRLTPHLKWIGDAERVRLRLLLKPV